MYLFPRRRVRMPNNIWVHNCSFHFLFYYPYMGDCQNYGPFWGPYYNTGPNTGPNLGDPKRDHNFDNPPYKHLKPLNLVGAKFGCTGASSCLMTLQFVVYSLSFGAIGRMSIPRGLRRRLLMVLRADGV